MKVSFLNNYLIEKGLNEEQQKEFYKKIISIKETNPNIMKKNFNKIIDKTIDKVKTNML